MDIGIILGIVGIVTAFIFWILSPEPFRQKMKRIYWRKLDTDSILALEEQGLVIENRDLLYDKEYLARHRYVYWPAVPTSSPNLIHVVFVEYARSLADAGLHIVLFIFNEYYGLIHGLDRKVAHANSRQFAKTLLSLGLDKARTDIIYESSIMKGKGSTLIAKHLLESAVVLGLGDLRGIGEKKHYINESVAFLRFMKPLLNMIYLTASGRDYGFTLSGFDEKVLWGTYNSKVREAKKYKLSNFYIPTMLSTTSSGTDILDKTYNITTSDSRYDIANKIQVNLKNLNSEGGFLYFLNHLRFKRRRSIQITMKNGDQREYFSDEKLISDIRKGDLGSEEEIASSIAELIFKILHATHRGDTPLINS